jgi:hypothetical protein
MPHGRYLCSSWPVRDRCTAVRTDENLAVISGSAHGRQPGPHLRARPDPRRRTRPAVLDRTALSGIFDIRLQFTPEAPGAPPSGAPGLSVFTAIREQLGLKLESTKGPVEFLVIDHIERPTAN